METTTVPNTTEDLWISQKDAPQTRSYWELTLAKLTEYMFVSFSYCLLTFYGSDVLSLPIKYRKLLSVFLTGTILECNCSFSIEKCKCICKCLFSIENIRWCMLFASNMKYDLRHLWEVLYLLIFLPKSFSEFPRLLLLPFPLRTSFSHCLKVGHLATNSQVFLCLRKYFPFIPKGYFQ